jgi:hypothetical protein
MTAPPVPVVGSEVGWTQSPQFMLADLSANTSRDPSSDP